MFHLNSVGNGNGDISSEEHFIKFENQERYGTYLLLDLLIFVQIFEFYLVTQSL